MNVPRSLAALATLVVALGACPAATQTVDPSLFAGLHWRCIGPFRGGRTVAATGVPGRPGLFYMGVNNGGVWRTTDYGRVWTPIFDAESTQSVGAIAVAPSDPNVIYVGSGEGLQRPDLSVGDGVYRSNDAGRTWRHLGLSDGQQIPALAVDPHDPERVFAAVLGHPYGPNHERGVFRSHDGGATWESVLHLDDDTGAMDVRFDPHDSHTLYAVLWAVRQTPWEGTAAPLAANDGLYKSSDDGTTWRALRTGLPGAAQRLGRIGVAIAPSDPHRLYAVVGADSGAGLYRSDDAGEHWRLANADPRLCERDGDFNEVQVDPRDPDVLYIANVVSWKSVDGGAHFAALRGAPGGDDYHRFWIDPDDSRVLILAGDQGAVITVNGGATWSSWYNQPTAQLYHVNCDRSFPYRVYGGQQESGSVGIRSRGDDGEINFRDWHPVGVEEYGYAVPDPVHPDSIYGGKLERYQWSTGQVQNVAPDLLRSGEHRWVRTMPVVFSPVDPSRLYLGSDVVFETRDGGHAWRAISPDLARPSYEVPATLGVFTALDLEKGKHRGVVYALAPSALRANLLWAGTDDGLLHVTHDDGGHWLNVTPPSLTPWSKVSVLEASHTDTLEAYAAINRFRLDDLEPHVLRTRDGGRTWVDVGAGIGAHEVVNAVREDPARRGLLYAGTERGVWVSFDDGDHWQSLRLDLPASAVRDLVVHDDDLVVATHGRSFWILDDVTPLRQAAAASAASDAFLFKPEPAWRVRWNHNTDTPIPPDEPAGENPPDGALIDYRIAGELKGPLTLEIVAADGHVVRHYSSADRPEAPDTTGNVPPYWTRASERLSAAAGTHRFAWDLRESEPPLPSHGYPIAAVEHDTPLEPRGPWALPGAYRVRLASSGKHWETPLEVRMDPRVHTSATALAAQHALALRLGEALRRASLALERLEDQRRKAADTPLAADLAALAGTRRRGPREQSAPSFTSIAAALETLYGDILQADVAPTATMLTSAATLEAQLTAAERRLQLLKPSK